MQEEEKKEREVQRIYCKCKRISGRELDGYTYIGKTIIITTHRGTFTTSSPAQPNAHLPAEATKHKINNIHCSYAFPTQALIYFAPAPWTSSKRSSRPSFKLFKYKPCLFHRLITHVRTAYKPPNHAPSSNLQPPPPRLANPSRSTHNPPTINDLSLCSRSLSYWILPPVH
ncbi:hypothetical protein P171DRAFT_486895 [Karstenula rhodostoma CBS 690.94]|uniref:Uncharacterized protein n=1 Tax=Karstenula rhodostoma CBS 690.94 TaxID=1392251 RepID=A0A9P4UB40_9PLEO|nr:hypothetical protein P171DRAFT_486895 [Karstenula rhodostoma CBS 690.94]